MNFILKHDFVISILFGCLLLIGGIYYALQNPKVSVKYDCSISEISPDYPLAVKEGCRKLRAKAYNEGIRR
jgi:hypothetical protein